MLLATLRVTALVKATGVSVYDRVVDTDLERVAHSVVLFGIDYSKFVHSVQE